jgi:hypothetical protein
VLVVGSQRFPFTTAGTANFLVTPSATDAPLTVTVEGPNILETTVTLSVNTSVVAVSWWSGYYEALLGEGALEDLPQGYGIEGDQPISRSLFTDLLVRALGLPVASGSTVPFSDVPAGAWYGPALAAAYQLGIVTGNPDGGFDPTGSLTRAQAAAILVRALKLPLVGGRMPFSDVRPGAWYAQDVATLYSAGLIKGVTRTTFGPDEPISEAQAFTLLLRAQVYPPSH